MVEITYTCLMASAAEDIADRSRPRGRSTRARLVQAAIDSLVEAGYAATTTIEVSKRAGVSRGSQLHHFPTRADLLAAAVDQLLQQRLAEFETLASLSAPNDEVETAIDVLWGMFQGPTFTAWVELWLAARVDEELRSHVVAMDREFMVQSRRIAAGIFGDDDPTAVAMGFTFALMDGLALQRLVPNDHLLAPERSIELLKLIAQTLRPQLTRTDQP